MDVRMEFESLAPGVQDHQAADPCAQVPWCGGAFRQGLPLRAKQKRVEAGGMGGRDRHPLVRHTQDHMEILDWQQLPRSISKPGGPFIPLAFGTMTVTAGVI